MGQIERNVTDKQALNLTLVELTFLPPDSRDKYHNKVFFLFIMRFAWVLIMQCPVRTPSNLLSESLWSFNYCFNLALARFCMPFCPFLALMESETSTVNNVPTGTQGDTHCGKFFPYDTNRMPCSEFIQTRTKFWSSVYLIRVR